jgi:hypothetical protein
VILTTERPAPPAFVIDGPIPEYAHNDRDTSVDFPAAAPRVASITIENGPDDSGHRM